MGTLFYGSSALVIPVEDRLLAHLRLVVTSKLRRHEGFLISWTENASTDRHSVWVHHATDLHYQFDEDGTSIIEQRVLNEMASHAMDSRGINLNDNRYAFLS